MKRIFVVNWILWQYLAVFILTAFTGLDYMQPGMVAVMSYGIIGLFFMHLLFWSQN